MGQGKTLQPRSSVGAPGLGPGGPVRHSWEGLDSGHCLLGPGRDFPKDPRVNLNKENDMPEWAKKILWTLVIAFIIYYIATQPEEFAAGVKSVVNALGRLFSALAN